MCKVHTGPEKPGKSWKKATGPGKFWKFVKTKNMKCTEGSKKN